MSKKYPEYSGSGAHIDQDNCWKRYSAKIKKMRESGRSFKYPINYKHVHIGDVGRTKIDEIAPSHFLRLALPKAHINFCSLDYLLDAFELGEPTAPIPFLRISFNRDKDRCDISGHEGRHRSEIANDLGIEKIPLFLKYNDYVYMDEKDRPDYNTMNELSQLLVTEDNNWENLMKYKDKSIYPNDCSIYKLYPEHLSRGKPEVWEQTKLERKAKRLEYGLD